MADSFNMKHFRELLENVEEESERNYVNLEDEYILPSHWNTALIYGDYSGIDDEEEQEIEDFLERNPLANYITSDVEELGFRSYNDANNLGSDVSRFKAFKRVPEEEADEYLIESGNNIDVVPGHYDNPRELKHFIAQKFEQFEKALSLLYPQDSHEATEVFHRFLKNQEIDLEKLKQLDGRLSKKVRQTGDAYDTVSNFTSMLLNILDN